MTYDDKIDAMHARERTDWFLHDGYWWLGLNARVKHVWRKRDQDKRNAERLHAYRKRAFIYDFAAGI